jgi:hypothetical protein
MDALETQKDAPMSKSTRDIPIVHLLLIVAAAIFAAEVIHTFASGEIWWPF